VSRRRAGELDKTEGEREEGAAASLATFEEATTRLAAIVEELERGDLPLERSLALFEEGVKLARAAQARIENAERRVEELLGVDPSGRPVTRELSRDPAGSRGSP
jgi:exodeoxyribonuclease VII small subunit